MNYLFFLFLCFPFTHTDNLQSVLIKRSGSRTYFCTFYRSVQKFQAEGRDSHIGSHWGCAAKSQKPADGCKFLPKNLRMGHNLNT